MQISIQGGGAVPHFYGGFFTLAPQGHVIGYVIVIGHGLHAPIWQN